jgi:hypothetical protein
MLNLINFAIVSLISGLMILLTCLIFYEVLYLVWRWIDKARISHRFKVFVIIMAIFGVHTLFIWMYGILYFMMEHFDFGYLIFTVKGERIVRDFMDYIYFSASAYSALGLGDVVPQKATRFIASVEALNGLVLIAWSASYTYLSMEKFWDVRKKGK